MAKAKQDGQAAEGTKRKRAAAKSVTAKTDTAKTDIARTKAEDSNSDLDALIRLTGPIPGPIALEVPKSQKGALSAPPLGAMSAPITGAVSPIRTVIYIHGIGNHPSETNLRRIWDHALFGTDLGDRSRMAYWVDRQRYPREVDVNNMGQAAMNRQALSMGALGMGALAESTPLDEALIEAQIQALTENELQRAWLRQVADEISEAGAQGQQWAQLSTQAGLHALESMGSDGARVRAQDVHALQLRVQQAPWLTNIFTSAILPDVKDFFFRPDRRARMEQALLDRLQGGGGPFLIIGHSQGSMIAYNVLRRLAASAIEVPLFITIGSPLGLNAVEKLFEGWVGSADLPVPPCVKRWVNVADQFDLVAAFDGDLRDDFVPINFIRNHFGLINQEFGQPHSATGYLRSTPVQDEVHAVAGPSFLQPMGKSIVMKDLVADFEAHDEGVRRPVLIQMKAQLAGDPSPAAFGNVQTALLAKLREVVAAHGATEAEARIEPLKRFVAAELTRIEVELLRTLYPDLQIDKVWRDAVKHVQIHKSTSTVQARPANLGYDALGKDIGWAVLDTGIQANHPHFAQYNNVICQWDCTQFGAPTVMEGDGGALMDVHGHGTHVAGIIAGSYTFRRESQPDQIFAGMAPAASLYGFKVLDDQGNGQDSYMIKALDFIADLNERAGRLLIHGVNLSLGGNFDPSVYGCGHTPLCQELRRLWGQGVLVCLAAGNEGIAALRGNSGIRPDLETNRFLQSNIDFSIVDPANLDEAIAVGSVHKENPYTYGVSFFSSRGPTADGRRKPDLVAPGEKILSALNKFQGGGAGNAVESLYIEMSGTSMAAPHVSGILAAFLSVRREFVENPNRVKRILLESCSDLGRDGYSQGAGLPNLLRMLANT